MRATTRPAVPGRSFEPVPQGWPRHPRGCPRPEPAGPILSASWAAVHRHPPIPAAKPAHPVVSAGHSSSAHSSQRQRQRQQRGAARRCPPQRREIPCRPGNQILRSASTPAPLMPTPMSMGLPWPWAEQNRSGPSETARGSALPLRRRRSAARMTAWAQFGGRGADAPPDDGRAGAAPGFERPGEQPLGLRPSSANFITRPNQ